MPFVAKPVSLQRVFLRVYGVRVYLSSSKAPKNQAFSLVHDILAYFLLSLTTEAVERYSVHAVFFALKAYKGFEPLLSVAK